MKYLLLVLIFVLTSFLSACSNNDTTSNQVMTPNIVVSQSSELDTSVLEDLVNAMNNHQVAEALDLFNYEAKVTWDDKFNLSTILPQTGWSYTYSGKEEIQSWLEFQIGAISYIVPVDYKVLANSSTLEAKVYYANQVVDIRMDAQTEGGNFNSLYFYFEKITVLSS